MGWPGRAQRLICRTEAGRREARLEHAMRTSQKTTGIIATIGIDIGKNTFHLVGLDKRGAIVLQQKVSRGQLERRLANIPRCRIGMEACSGAHHIGRQLAAVGHDVRLIPAQYVKPFLKGHKNDYRDAEAIAVAARDAVNRLRKRAVKEGRGVPVIWFSDLDLDFGVSESAEVACSVERALSANQSENTHIVADLWRLAARAYHFAKKDEDKNRCLAAAVVVHHRAFGFRPGIGLGSPSGQVAA